VDNSTIWCAWDGGGVEVVKHTVFLAPDSIEGMAAGHPSIWRNNELYEQASEWLSFQVVPYSRSPNTWAQAARALVTWLEFCEAAEIDWRYASRDDLVSYRDSYLNAISPLTERQYSSNTVRTRMSYILSFIEYAAEKGWYDSDIVGLPISTGSRTRGLDSDALAQTRRGARIQVQSAARRLLPRHAQDDTVRVLRRDELLALLRWAGPRPSERQAGDPGCARDRVILDLGWAVGLREDEIHKLKIYSFQHLVPDPNYLGESFRITVTRKGGKKQQVDVPAWLVVDIQSYIGRRRGSGRRHDGTQEGQLILNCNHSRRAGYPMTISGMKSLMVRACEGAGLIEKRERINSETGEVAAVAGPRFSLHCLRHTYAVMQYHAMKLSRHDDFERWKYIQLQLGHSSPRTTMDIYLKHVETWSSKGTSQKLLDMMS